MPSENTDLKENLSADYADYADFFEDVLFLLQL
jgi:hypothetical protein